MTGGTIVCGVNETVEGRGAAELAAALGARLGLRLVLVHVLDGVPAAARESVSGRQHLRGAERMLDGLANELGDGAERRLVVGRRSDGIASVAAEEGADVIVVGSRPAGLRGKTLRSRLARELEAATPVPVLVAPPATREHSARRLAVAAERVAR
ncbi:MAG TPA: universal stress protein [Gaiellaceae bacterium]|jgi:nucleotide-binding universal stress UspA family protein